MSAPLSEAEATRRGGRRLMIGIVFGVLGTSVLVHLVALGWAFTANTDLVRDDYYESGLRHEGELELFRASAGLGWSLWLEAAAEPGDAALVLAVAGLPAGASAGSASVRLYRPDRRDLDRRVALIDAEPAGAVRRWTAVVPGLEPGRWRARVELTVDRAYAHEVLLAWEAGGGR